MTCKHVSQLFITLALALTTATGHAVVSAQEAARLKSELTPFGAEKAGNQAGTIPAWNGGYTRVWPGYRSGEPRPDPFSGQKPLFRVTAANMDQYADKLSDGVKELLRRFSSYRLDVYPTHRTAAAPQWVYDNTFRNATRADTRDDGLAVQGAYGGIPFPIPKTGREAMWNHLLAWKGEATTDDAGIYLVSGAKPVLAVQRRADFQYPYYYRNGNLESFRGIYALERYLGIKPPSLAGQIYLIHEPIDKARRETRSWVYLVGQRRVRPAAVAYDTPEGPTSGASFIDEGWLFRGAMDRYDWRLLGKQEMFVPYNNNGFFREKVAQVLGGSHLNPDHVRWELHRVWVVEASLARDKRHPVARRRLYLDEDSWLALLYDGWDGKGRLWHTAHALPLILPELPGIISFPDAIYDLLAGRYAGRYLFNEGAIHVKVVPPIPEDHFSPAALVGEGVR